MASRDKILLDTDAVLDHLADRQPFAEYAHRNIGWGYGDYVREQVAMLEDKLAGP